jgi:plasmid stabilization system protein ParE
VKRFWIEPVALTELEEAAAWYESQRPELGDEFIAEVARTLARIEHEEQFATAPVETLPGANVRREFVHRFPYIVFFVETPDSRRVILIRRGNTNPALWRSRL